MGYNVPTLELLLRLKAHSGKSIDWIVTGEADGRENHSVVAIRSCLPWRLL
jgi:hypothetical protein